MSYQLQAHANSSYLIHLDSRDASHYIGGNSHFHYVLKDKLIVPSNQAALVSLHSATIPYSFYNIREGVNDLIFWENNKTSDGTDVGNGIYTIPAGNYSAFSLANNISANLPSSGGVGAQAFNLTLTFSNDTQKYTFTTSTDDTTINFLFGSGANIAIDSNIELGFPNGKDVSFNKTTPLVSVNVVDINGSIHGVYVRTSLTSQSLIDSQNSNLSNILARIPIQVQSGGIIFFNPRDSVFKSKVHLPDIDNITIQLTDERNRELNLNGLHFQISIQVDFIYKEKVIQPETAEDRRGEKQNGIILNEDKLAENAKLVRAAIAEGQAKIIENKMGEAIVVPKYSKKEMKAQEKKEELYRLFKEEMVRKAEAVNLDLELGITSLGHS